MSLDSIIGQPRAVRLLKDFLRTRRVPPGLLFYGPEGTGKMPAAKEFAKALNCLDKTANENLDSCGVCASCVQADKGIHTDITVVDFAFQALLEDKEVEKQQHINVDTIRQACTMAQQKSSGGRYKIFIVDKAETMLPAAGNALLKLLEEPPERTLWLLLTANRDAMLSTINSRSQAVAFSALNAESVQEILMRQSFPRNEAALLARLSAGSVTRALRVRDLLSELANIDDTDPLYPFAVSKLLPRELAAARTQAGLMLELLIESAHAQWKTEQDADRQERLKNAMEKFFEYRRLIGRNVTPSLLIEAALLETAGLHLPFVPKDFAGFSPAGSTGE